MICHPTQTHIKLAGGEDGTLTIWDLRNNKLAMNSISAHAQSGLVANIQFFTKKSSEL